MSDIKTNQQMPTYNYGEIVTPYADMGQDYDAPIGQYRVSARLFQVLTLCFALATICLLAIFILECNAPRDRIVVVQLNSSGKVYSTAVLKSLPVDHRLYQKTYGDIHGQKS